MFSCLEREIMSTEEGGVMPAMARIMEPKTSSEEEGILAPEYGVGLFKQTL